MGKLVSKKVETIIKDFPSKINGYRGVSKRYDVIESIEILSKNALMKDIEVKKLTKSTNTFSSEGYEDVSSPAGTKRLYNVSFRTYLRYVIYERYTTLLQRL